MSSNNNSSYRSPQFCIDMVQQQQLTIDQFFLLLLPALFISKKKKTMNEISLYYSYLFYLQDFVKMIQTINPLQYKTILFTIATLLCFEKWEKDRLLMRIGDKGEKFYLILKGKIDVLIFKERYSVLLDKEYYRYIAFLIGYKEYDIVSRVLNANADKHPLLIVDVSYGKVTKNIPQGVIPIVMTLNDLLKHLTDHERELVKEGFENNPSTPIDLETYYKHTPLSTKEFIERIKPLEIKEPIEQAIESNPKAIKVIIVEYYYITSLSTGQKFGDRALSDPSAKRTATIITSDKCYFGILNKKSYNASLKEVTDQMHKEILKLILSTYVFKDMSMDLLLKKYFNYFVRENVKKGFILFQQGKKCEDVIIAREGEYEITARVSIKKISKIINVIFSTIKKPAYEYSNEEYLIAKSVLDMNNEDNKLNDRAEDIKLLDKFLKTNEEIHICHFKAQDIIGLGDSYKRDYKSLFSYRTFSIEGELYYIKREFYNQMRANDPSIRRLEREYVIQKKLKMISRLLNLRQSKLKIYFQHHPDYAYFKQYCLSKNYDEFVESFRNNKSSSQRQCTKKAITSIFNIPKEFTNWQPINSFINQSLKNTEKSPFKTLNSRKKTLRIPKKKAFSTNLKELIQKRLTRNPIQIKIQTFEKNNNAIQRKKNLMSNPNINSNNNPSITKRGLSQSKTRNKSGGTWRQLSNDKNTNTQLDSLMRSSSFCCKQINYDDNFSTKTVYQMPFQEQTESQRCFSPFPLNKSSLKKSSSAMTILGYTIEKKVNYINNYAKDALKRTRGLVFKHKSKVSLVKKS